MLSVGPQADNANFGRVGRLLRSWAGGSEPDIREKVWMMSALKRVILLVVILESIPTVEPQFVAKAQMPHYDLLLKGGHVIDPANEIDKVMDVAISGGR